MLSELTVNLCPLIQCPWIVRQAPLYFLDIESGSIADPHPGKRQRVNSCMSKASETITLGDSINVEVD